MSDGSNKDPQRALVFATGDIIVDEPDPYSFFEHHGNCCLPAIL